MNILLAQNSTTTRDAALPIQRTIEVENSDGLTASQITTKDQADTSSQKQVVFGLVAVLLVVVAVVAVAVLWQNKN